ncbi:MAG: glutamyl-tRNA reductase [Candidatus Sericytochromatia bacterium]
MQFVLVGVNYKSAALEVRERLSCDTTASQHLLTQLFCHSEIHESVLLSTCNRTEIYAITPDPQAARAAIMQALSERACLPLRDLETLTYTYYNKFAANHLFEVSAGLDSLVLGENEILRQVKDALSLARQLEAVGPILNQLFRFAITAGKRVRHETQINEGCASLGALAARLLRDSLAPDARVLILGAGQMARILVKNLHDSGLQLHIANRTEARAEMLAEVYAGEAEAGGLDSVPGILGEVDAIVSCTASHDYVVSVHELGRRRRCHHPLLLIDLSVPRNLDPVCAELENVSYYDVDRLENVIQTSLEQRQLAASHAQSIIAEESTRFLEWFHNRELAPTIRALQSMFEDIRQRELSRGSQKYREALTPEAEIALDRITHAITQKILHYPVVRLKNVPNPQQQAAYHAALNELFGLNTPEGIEKYVHLPVKAAPVRNPQLS